MNVDWNCALLRTVRVSAAALFAACSSHLALAAPAACESLSPLKLDHTVIASAQAVPAGPFQVVSFMGPTTVDLPAFCRVILSIRPTADSDIGVEVWLPVANWNGRLQSLGNGGLAGVIDTAGMASALRAGYAAAATDTGHHGSPASGDWALHHPEKVADFGFRSEHEMTVEAKALIAAFYGSGPKYSYWNGCSEGGNQALTEAQQFPADYDGILAGAPANYFFHLMVSSIWTSHAIHKDPATFLAPAKLPGITAAVMAQCDAADGVKDGVLEDPRTCHFDPAALLCKGEETASCLTAPQIEGLRKLYGGAKNPRTGELIFPGYIAGGEAGWGLWIAGTDVPPRDIQHLISSAGLSNIVFDDANWDSKTFDFDKDVAMGDKKVGGVLNHINPDLSAFKAHGGKLLQYHGWNDPAISPLNSVNYFESVQKKMGDTASFYRLFMIPGMEHCMGGPGASDFDHMQTIVKWVEDGVAPERIVAKRGDRTHPLCPYPQVAKYSGKGSTDDAANYTCAAP